MNPLVAYYLFTVGILLPYLVIRSTIQLKKVGMPQISMRKLYIQTTINIVALTVLACLIAFNVGMILFRPWQPQPLEIGIGLAMLFGYLFLRDLLMPWLRKSFPPNSPVRMPTTPRQLFGWAGISLIAGVGEEIIYRGVLFNCLWWWIGQPVIAAIISSIIFGVVHATQGYRSAIFITVLALTLHGLVWISGSLYMAMIVHTTFDFIVGFRYFLASKKAATV